MLRFFVYEEYGAKYEMMLRDLTSTSRSIPNWHAYERGIEALANSLASTNTQGETSRKGLTFEDLLIKVLQNTQLYPLFLLTRVIISRSNESASIRFFSTTFTDIPLLLTVQTHVQRLRKCYVECGKQHKRSTKQQTTRKHRPESKGLGAFRIS